MSADPPRTDPLTRIRALGLAALLAALVGCERPAASPRPNVLLVTLDTTRADFLGCYGRAGNPTPAIDRLAREGCLFRRAQASSGITPVSHATILTGLEPPRHGLRVFAARSGYRLRPEQPTLASALRATGYHTAAVTSAFPASATFGLDTGFEHFDGFDAGIVDALSEGMARVSDGLPQEAFQRRADQTTERVLALLPTLREPFFLWVHYFDPHDAEVLPPDAFLRRDLSRPPVGRESPWEEVYLEELRFLDRELERVFAALGRSGLADRTLAVLTADHGQGLEDGRERHGWGGHATLYQEQLHVPLVVRAPWLEGGQEVDALVRTVDILPTVLDLVDVAPPAAVDGASLRPWVEGRGLSEPPRVAYAEQINGYDFHAEIVARRSQDDFLYSLHDGRWKLIYRPAHPARSELFDLERDPLELDDRKLEEPEVLERLLIDLARREPWVVEPFAGDEGVDERLTAALLSLGYAGGEHSPVEPRWGWRCPRCGETRDARADCAGCRLPTLLVVR